MRGVLKSSDLCARPPPELRELVWYRQSLIQARSPDVNRVQQRWQAPTSRGAIWCTLCSGRIRSPGESWHHLASYVSIWSIVAASPMRRACGAYDAAWIATAPLGCVRKTCCRCPLIACGIVVPGPEVPGLAGATVCASFPAAGAIDAFRIPASLDTPPCGGPGISRSRPCPGRRAVGT